MKRIFASTTLALSAALTSSTSSSSRGVACPIASSQQLRALTVNGRVTNEDRRWWLLHLECSPDVTLTTFVGWLDCAGEHTCKKLIERNIWTIEQVAALTSDEVDEMRYGEGCVKVDIVWEHARTILGPLRQRNLSGGVESELQDRVLQMRKRRELERQKANILKERGDVAASREETAARLREAIAAKKEALRKKQMERLRTESAAAAESGKGAVDDMASRLQNE